MEVSLIYTTSSLSSASLTFKFIQLAGILAPKLYSASQWILKIRRNFVVDFELLRVLQAFLLRYDANLAKDDEILVRLETHDIVAIDYTLEISQVLQSNVQ